MAESTTSTNTAKPQIEKTYWGNVGGKSIWLYKLGLSDGFQINVSNYGAIVQSLVVPTTTKKSVDVVLGYDSLNEYIHDPFYIGAVVGRFSNRIDGGIVFIHNKRYQLSVTPGGFHQHGGNIGFNKKVWDAEPFSTVDSVGIILTYTSIHLEEGFPGNLKVKIVYTLYDKHKWRIEFFAETDHTTLINLTQHSYFNLNSCGTILDHSLQTNAQWYLPATERQIPNGNIDSVNNTPFDFLALKRIGDDIDSPYSQLIASKGYDHYFVLEKRHSLAMKKAGVLADSQSGLQMEFSTTEPGFHFYSGNFLAETFAGKNAMHYHTRSGLCLETHHFPDAPNHAHFPNTLLEPDQVFTSKTEFCFASH